MLKEIRAELQKLADEKIAESNKAFFKNQSSKSYGMRSADVLKVAKKYFKQIDAMDKAAVFALCEELFKNEYMEEFGIGIEFLHRKAKDYKKSDFSVFARWLDLYADNWAKVDSASAYTYSMLGVLLIMYPELAPEIKKWARHKNRWMRRASAVAFIGGMRGGHDFAADIFEVADALISDQDDMVQKGYGWTLKELSNRQPQIVYDFVVARRDIMPRTAYRYAIEKLPTEMRKSAMSV